MGVMGVSMLSPVLPELRSVFGVSDAQVGLVLTAYTLPGIVLTPLVGLAADRVGRRQVLVPLLFTFGIAGGAIGLVNSFAMVLGLRFLQGVGAAGLVTLAVTIIGDIYSGGRRDAVMGINGSILGVGAAFYPLLGGALAAIRWNVPFLFFGIGILVGILALFVLPAGVEHTPTSAREYFMRMGAVAKLPRALAIFVAIFTAFFIFYGAVLTVLPLLLSDTFGLSTSQIGPVLAMVSIASAAVSSQYRRISKHRKAAELVALGFVAYGLSLLFVWLSPSVPWVAVSLLFFGVGFGIVMPSIDTAVVTLVSDDLRAGMMGMRTSLLRLGQTLGPVGFTAAGQRLFVSTTQGYRTLLLGAGLLAIIGGGFAYLGLRLGSGQ